MAWKGYSWSITLLITCLIYSVIPTYMIIKYWVWLNELTFNGEPIYTLSLFMLFLWIVCLLVGIIYLVASARAIVQRKNDDLGIPKGVKRFSVISNIIIIGFILFWFIFTSGEIAFISWKP